MRLAPASFAASSGRASATPHSPAARVDGPLVDFSYVIRGPRRVPHIAVIHAHGDPARTTTVTGSFDDAVRAAHELAREQVDDGLHRLRVQPAHAVLQAQDGAWLVTPLLGPHRDAVGPLFVDGDFFDRTTLSLQVARTNPAVAAVVGATALLDLRSTGAATHAPSSEHLDTPRKPTVQ